MTEPQGSGIDQNITVNTCLILRKHQIANTGLYHTVRSDALREDRVPLVAFSRTSGPTVCRPYIGLRAEAHRAGLGKRDLIVVLRPLHRPQPTSGTTHDQAAGRNRQRSSLAKDHITRIALCLSVTIDKRVNRLVR